MRIACFTFDNPSVVGALLRARTRGVEVKLMFSHRDRGMTRNQESRLQQIRAAGGHVRGLDTPRLHAKWMLADATLIVGSTNFTEASLSNVERAAVVTGLSPAQLASEASWYDRLFDGEPAFTAGIGARTPGR